MAISVQGGQHLSLIGKGTFDLTVMGGGSASLNHGFLEVTNGADATTWFTHSGQSSIVGGSGADVFRFDMHSLINTVQISNFQQGIDQLILTGNTLQTLEATHSISVVNGNTEIHLGTTTIELVGITSLNASDFGK